jgi:hypothetical protein
VERLCGSTGKTGSQSALIPAHLLGVKPHTKVKRMRCRRVKLSRVCAGA